MIDNHETHIIFKTICRHCDNFYICLTALFFLFPHIYPFRNIGCKACCARNVLCMDCCSLSTAQSDSWSRFHDILSCMLLFAPQSQVDNYFVLLCRYLLQSPFYFHCGYRKDSQVYDSVLRYNDGLDHRNFSSKLIYEQYIRKPHKSLAIGLLDRSCPSLRCFLFRCLISLPGICISRIWRTIRKPSLHKNYSRILYRLRCLCLYYLDSSARIALAISSSFKSSRLMLQTILFFCLHCPDSIRQFKNILQKYLHKFHKFDSFFPGACHIMRGLVAVISYNMRPFSKLFCYFAIVFSLLILIKQGQIFWFYRMPMLLRILRKCRMIAHYESAQAHSLRDSYYTWLFSFLDAACVFNWLDSRLVAGNSIIFGFTFRQLPRLELWLEDNSISCYGKRRVAFLWAIVHKEVKPGDCCLSFSLLLHISVFTDCSICRLVFLQREFLLVRSNWSVAVCNFIFCLQTVLALIFHPVLNSGWNKPCKQGYSSTR